MQIGVFDGSAVPPVSEAEQLRSNVSRLVENARNAAIPVIFVQHNGQKGHPLEYGTSGWHIHPDLKMTGGDLVFQKRTPDSFYDTGLQETLVSNNVKRLIVAGIQTEFCIDTTCRRAFSLGYEVILVKDAHSTWDTDQLSAAQIVSHHNAALSEWFVSLKAVDEIDFETL